MKNLLRFLAVLIIFSVLTSVCYASTAESVLGLYKSEYEADFEAIKNDLGVTDLTFDNSYKQYYYELPVDCDKSFSEKIEENKFWWKKNDGKRWIVSYTIGHDTDKWITSGLSSFPVFPDKDGNPIDVDFSVNGLTKLVSEKIEGQVSEFKIVYFEGIRLIYVIADGKEYIIPYSHRPDFNGLENGKVYDANEADQIMLKNLGFLTSSSENTTNTADNTTSGGGAGSANTDSNNILWIASALLILIISMTAFIFVRKRKK